MDGTPWPAHVTALEQLVERVRLARSIGLLDAEWLTLAETALTETRAEWEGERAFRLRTGTGERWCQRNFARCQAAGLARRDAKGRREWHIHARLPRRKAGGELVREIVASFERRAG